MKNYKILFLFLLLTSTMQAQRVKSTMTTGDPMRVEGAATLGSKPVLLDGPVGVLTPVSEETPVGDPGNGGMGAERKVVWVHGLEGSLGSWGHYAPKFQSERKMTSFSVQYANKNAGLYAESVDEAVEKIKPQLNSNNIIQSASTNTIFVAHSLGGLVTRALDKQMSATGQNPYYGGFVTFSTPHKGAIIAQSLAEGKVHAFLDDGTHRLLKGPLLTASSILTSIFLPVSTSIFGTITLDHFAEKAKQAILSQFNFARGPAVDLPPNSGFMNRLNGYTPNKPMVLVAAKEDDATLWREVSSLVYQPADLPLHQTADQEVPKYVNIAINVYGGIEDYYHVIKFFNPFLFADREAKQLAYHSGKMWLVGAPGVWNDLIGSNRTESVTVPFSGPTLQAEQEWIGWKTSNCIGGRPSSYGYGPCYSFTEYANVVLSPAQRAAAYGTYMRTYTTRIMNEENDGIVLKSSSQGLNGAFLTEIAHVNHQECMNHSEVTQKLNEVFNASGGVDPFFRTNPR
jgi:pimeloyl-ACP methyl ester carboxylesterase